MKTCFPTYRTLCQGLACVALLTAGLPGAAQAPARQDALLACEAVEDHLTRELGPAVQMYGRSGTAHVAFRWRADGDVDVAASGGPPEYRAAIRRAVRGLRCPRAGRGDRFVLDIRFDPEAETPGGPPAQAAAGLPTRAARHDDGPVPR